MDQVGLFPVIAISLALFVTGIAGVVTRRNAIIVLMSVELMLNSVNLAFVAFARHLASVDGQVFAVFVMAVAAAEAGVGLALIILLFRHRESVNLKDFNILRG